MKPKVDRFLVAVLTATVLIVGAITLRAQVPTPIPSTPVQAVSAYYAVTPISSTAATGATTTLTIPTPQSGQYNYVCTLGFNASQNGTAAAQSNAVTTSTNFNSFALKFSIPATINISYDWYQRWGEPGTGCAKSASPGTATTFVSPAGTANIAFTWYATYFQAP